MGWTPGLVFTEVGAAIGGVFSSGCVGADSDVVPARRARCALERAIDSPKKHMLLSCDAQVWQRYSRQA